MKKFLSLLMMALLCVTTAWADTVELTNSSIVNATQLGSSNESYRTWEMIDNQQGIWQAFANKGSHSGATSAYHFLQIKKYVSTSNTAYYIQVPEYGTKITQLEMTVSSTSKPMDGGGNTATLFFSASNSTSAAGTGVASGTGASSVTIDCSSLNLNTGYITASGAVRIWNVIVTYETSAAPYTISYGTPTNGSFASENPTSAIAGSSVTIATTPADGYALSAVTVDPSANVSINGNNASFTMPASNVTVNASFSALYGITVTNGTASPTTAYEGQTVTLTPTIPDGKVVDWDNTTVNPTTVVINHSNYTFTMPGEAVSVTFAFKDAPSGGVATYIFNTDAGLAALGITKPASGAGTDIAGNTYTVGQVSFTSTNGSTETRVWNSNGETDLRVYKEGGSFTLTVPSDYTITNVEITGSSVSSITPSIGNYSNGTWEGEAQEITFTATGTLKINTITVTYQESISVSDMYILGMVNGNGEQPNQGVKMNYSNGSYSANIWVIGNSANAMGVPGTWFAFTTVLANDNDTGGWGYVNNNRYSPTPDNGKYYWLNSGSNVGVLASEVPLTKQSNDNAFLIPAGLYTVTLTPSTTTGKDWDFNLTAIKDLTPTITPEGGEVALNSTATVAFSEDFNTFIASCNPVVKPEDGSIVTVSSITPPVATLYVNDAAVEGTSSEYPFTTEGEVTITGKGALVAGGSDFAVSPPASATFDVSQVYNVTVLDNITGGSVTASPKNNVRPGRDVYVTVTASYNYVLNTLIVDGTDVASQVQDGQYTFIMPDHNVEISATFNYNGPVATTKTFARIKSTDDLVVGEKYLIVNESAKKALKFNGASSTVSEDIDFNNNQTSILETDAAILTLGISDDVYTFATGESYVANSSSTDITLGSTYNTWTVTFDEDYNAVIYHTIPSNSGNSNTDRYVRYKNGFKAYATNNSYSSSSPVQLYREVTVAKLEDIEKPNVGIVGKGYSVSNDLQVVAISKAESVAFARDLTTTYVECPEEATDFMVDVVHNANDHQDGPWQKNNWVMLDFKPITAEAFTALLQDKENYIIQGGTLSGIYSNNNNYTIKVTSTPTLKACGDENTYKPYKPNVYSPANFQIDEYGYQYGLVYEVDEDGNVDYNSEPTEVPYWFMTPQVMEVCKITWAMWYDQGAYANKPGFYMQNGTSGLKGGIPADFDYNNLTANPQNGTSYRFTGVIMKADPVQDPDPESGSKYEPQTGSERNEEFKVAAVDLDTSDESDQIITGVSEVKTGSDVVSVTYCDLAGRMSQKPFAGVNIIMTRYSDGTVKTTKAIK